MTAEPKLQTLRDDLIDAVLPHVPFDGWTHAALRRAAEEAGRSMDEAHRAFPHGPAGMVEHFSLMSDRRMLEALEKIDLASMRVPDRIAAAVHARLEQAAPHREAVRRAVAFLSLPHNAALGARCLYRTVDAIWRAAGDTATDWNFYSKRGLLAGVFGATVLYWLGDKSDGFSDTWAFLDRRLADVAQLQRTTGRIRERLSGLPRPFDPYRAGRRRGS